MITAQQRQSTRRTPIPPGSLGVRDAARRLGMHENTVRNWVKSGKIRPVKPPPYMRFTEAEIERVLGLMYGHGFTEHALGPATVGILVTLRTPPGMTPEQAVAEVRRGIEFGSPEVRLHFVMPDATEEAS